MADEMKTIRDSEKMTKTKPQIRAVFIGDSITHGVGDEAILGGWPGRLLRREQSEGRSFTLYNLGIRSDTSKDIEKRWQGESMARLPHQVKPLLIFSFGLNDATVVDGSFRVPLDKSIETCRRFLRKAQQMGDVLWIGPTPIQDESQPLVSSLGITQVKSNAATAEYNLKFSELASELGIPFLDTFSLLSKTDTWDSYLSDGVHPNGSGYNSICNVVYDWHAWRKLLDHI